MATKASKFYVRVNEAQLGPFTESKVQRMIRDGELEKECYVKRDGAEEWQLASSIIARLATQEQKDGMRVLGMSVARGLMFDQAEGAIQIMISGNAEKAKIWSRWKSLSQKKAEVLQAASVGGHKEGISPFLLEWFLAELQETDPDKFCNLDPNELLRQFEQLHATESWRDDPATEPQIRLLQSKGVRIPASLSKGEAHDLIDLAINVVTEGQQRRLRFYGIDSSGLTKDQATDLIDHYIGDHPDAEYQYQLWKAQELRTHPALGMTNCEWGAALEWASQQSVEAKFVLPDAEPDDEAASRKQLQYIRSMVQEIDEVALQKLTKRQACSFIDQVDARKKAFAKSKAEEYVRLHPRRAKPNPVIVLLVAGFVVALAIVLLFGLLGQ